ncbi:hypothetical protein ES288_A05G357600v1 [Gossypium darwinii]|uniref:Endonuclease/exonuclease/phosphatase domain-containing protein n=1 Tax=Gossypium darwinii TaxID=34276 RepID=A0A5D2GPN6_GOSDA|nr:hypothetical protein ES288_A05G357600v1 [Gossypium darwinii]
MKILCWNCRGVGNLATVREFRQLLVANVPDIVFLCETKINSNRFQRIRSICRMEGCLAVDSAGKSGGLALLWRDGLDVLVQNYSNFHIDSLVRLENEDVLRFTGFYGQTASRSRQQAWDILRRVHHKVNEGWIVGGDFKAILNLSEKEGGVTNNREGDRLVKERLDRFVASDVILDKFPFLASYVVRQSRSDHEAILIDTEGSKPNRERTGHKAWFRYDTCWAGEQELKDLISSIWEKEESNMLAKMDMTRDKLGPWQFSRFRNLKYKIKGLEKEISRLMDGRTDDRTACLLKQDRGKLGHLYDVEEKYWALRARSQWLREGDKNTRYFHVRASGRRRKNKISRLKDEQGNWHDNEEEICGIA